MNYSDDKLVHAFETHGAAVRGSKLHDLAKNLIELGVKLPRSEKTLNMYVNDAIDFRMVPEQPLFVSRNAFGTADAACFRYNVLRLHDLKTGTNPAKVTQLEIYAAFFCLEYNIKPKNIEMEFRLYQNDEVAIFKGDPLWITEIMAKVLHFDAICEAKREELS